MMLKVSGSKQDNDLTKVCILVSSLTSVNIRDGKGLLKGSVDEAME